VTSGGGAPHFARMVPAFLTTILFSISAVCATRTTRIMGGTEANFWRLIFATALLAIWAYGFGAGAGGSAFALFFISGCIGFGMGDLALFQALPRLGSRLTILLVQCLAAPFAAVSEWIWMGTVLSGSQILWGATILAGVAIALAPRQHVSHTPRQLWVGIFFGVVAAFGQGFGAVLSRKAFAIAELAGENIDGITAAYQRILGGVLVGGIFLLIVKREAIFQSIRARASVESGHKWKKAWPWILVNGLAGPALGVSCYQWALKTTPTGVVLPIVALTPLVVMPFARYMEGDRVPPRALIGGLIAVAGVIALTMVT
jgi:drug/metabolite transporter (DMT)-like permease